MINSSANLSKKFTKRNNLTRLGSLIDFGHFWDFKYHFSDRKSSRIKKRTQNSENLAQEKNCRKNHYSRRIILNFYKKPIFSPNPKILFFRKFGSNNKIIKYLSQISYFKNYFPLVLVKSDTIFVILVVKLSIIGYCFF